MTSACLFQSPTRRAFTLIELLIVIGIIAILALIAIPNFMAAQTRAKVSRVQADFKSINTAIAAYRVDCNVYPPDNFPGQTLDMQSFALITTPIAYITTIPQSPFTERSYTKNPDNVYYYEYWLGFIDPATGVQNLDTGAMETGIFWRATSSGPDLVTQYGSDFDNSPRLIQDRAPQFLNGLYDPTNGSVSSGDLLISSRGIEN